MSSAPGWLETVNGLIHEARKDLERAARARSGMRATELQHAAICRLMEAVEIHNDNFRFKVTADGKKVS